MPNTLNLIAKRGMTFNRYYVSYPLCCPSRVSLLTGRYAHNNNVRGNVPPNGGYTGFKARAAYTHNLATWLQGAGYRTIHIGKFLNGYGDEPFDKGTDVPPGWSAWHTVLNADTDHYFYGYTLNNNGVGRRPVRRLRQLGNARIRRTRRLRLPLRAAERQTLLLRDRQASTSLAPKSCTRPRPNSPSTCSSTTPRRTATSAARPGRSRRRATTTRSRRALPAQPRGRASTRATSTTSRASSAKRPTSRSNEIHTYRVYYQKALESLRSIDEGVKLIVDTLGALHRLRNTYIIFTSDNGFFYGEHRLTGGKFLAYEPSTHLPLPDPRAGDQTRHRNRRAGGQHRHRADDPRTGRGRRRTKASTAARWCPTCRTRACARRRPLLFESFVETADVEANGEPTGQRPVKEASPAASAAGKGGASASIVAPPKDYEGIRLGPYKYIEWPDGEKELYDITKDPYELNNVVRVPNLSPIRAFLHAQLVRLEACVGRDLPGSGAEIPADPRAAAQGRQAAARRRTAERTEREEKRHHKRGK